MKDQLILWLAQGLGAGRAPVAPGTFGSLVGLLWLGLCMSAGSYAWLLVGTVVGIAAAVPLCRRAETLLKCKDPPSVVLDEVVAVPLCYLGWLGQETLLDGRFPTWTGMFTGQQAILTAAGFVLFRLLDALKPPPIRNLERLAGGWGIVADDLAAGLVTGVVILVARVLLPP
jgi:phosphatidylglycerophosphatase A